MRIPDILGKIDHGYSMKWKNILEFSVYCNKTTPKSQMKNRHKNSFRSLNDFLQDMKLNDSDRQKIAERKEFVHLFE